MAGNIIQVIIKNLFGFDALIFVLAAVNVAVYVTTLRASRKLYKMMHISLFVPERDAMENATKRLTGLTEMEVVEMRNRANSLYILYTNLTAIFPLMGILGTVLSLLPMVNDLSSVQTNFFAALTSTFWGLVFAITFKLIDGSISSKVEDNEKTVALFLDRKSAAEGK